MYFNRNGFALIALWILGAKAALAQQNQAVEIEMIAQPNNCVALTQGRRCYAQVNVTWTATTQVNVCLVDVENQVNLQCWRSQNQGQFVYELASATDVKLGLQTKINETSRPALVANTTIKVSWLYEGNNRKRRWRLF